MRLLLIAYEFPPSPSPQSLRWIYLVRELSALGHEIHVLAPDLGGETPGLPSLPDGVQVHRCFAGPFRGLMAWRRRRRQSVQAAPGGASAPTMLRPPRNWKQRISESVQAALEWVLFPDLRGEWKPWATRELDRLLPVLQPDLVISSHEPATTLELGLRAHAQGFPLVADLGDPVLAGYTPARWRARARTVEERVFRHAALVTVTTRATAALLRERYAREGDHPARPIEVVTQGFDARLANSPAQVETELFDPGRVELLYTGSLYRFRRIDALLDALAADPALRLSIAAVTVPEHILATARALPAQIRLLGFLPHAAILELQRQADVLVNLANDDMTQVPGKVFEYLGAQRPILHLGRGDDPTATLIRELRRGWVCTDPSTELAPRLHALARAKAESRLDEGLDLALAPIMAYSWSEIAAGLDRELRALGASDRPADGPYRNNV